MAVIKGIDILTNCNNLFLVICPVIENTIKKQMGNSAKSDILIISASLFAKPIPFKRIFPEEK